ncbi:MAG TPA: phosphatidylserine decarboxylase family protein [Gemmatimonadales bacterium]|nr:phosphatidylserine decarboxylase family protein [Gemmatimonadales bacterium]
MRVAPEGRPFILAAWVILGALAAFRLWPAALAWLPVAVWVVAFFRDPARPGPRGDRLVLAPADGLVVSVREIHEPEFLGGTARRISIFMNVFDVHVNRYPADGTVAFRRYVAGRFVNAAGEKASLENEQCSIGLETAHGRVLVRQIAGLVARRIVTDHQPGQAARQGERMGLIRFGSRVDVFLPPGTTPRVREGDRTRAGQTVIAEWPA